MLAHVNTIGLLATDTNGSPLAQHASTQFQAFSYTAYGYDLPDTSVPRLLGFNAQPRALPDIYLLGNGYRCFNTTLMRFTSPDSLSPFDAGGFNAYVYCAADPINHTDPSGHVLITPKGSSIGQHAIPAKPRWIQQIPSIDHATRIAMLEKQRVDKLVTRTGLSNFSAYLKKQGVPGNLQHRAPLNALVEEITNEIQNIDNRLPIIQHGNAGTNAYRSDVQTQNAAIAQQSQPRIAKVQQQSADVRQGSKD